VTRIERGRAAVRALAHLTLAACALLAGAETFGATARASHPVTLEDLQSLAFPDVTLALSPDGESLAYALGGDSLWLIRTRPGATPQRIGAGFLPLWSPTGDRLAFYSVASGDVQLWIYDMKSQSAAQLTHLDGGIDPDPATRVVGYVHDAFRYDWSSDARHIVFASRVRAATQPSPLGVAERSAPSPAAPLVLDRNTPPDWTLSGIFAHARLSAGTLESKDGHSMTPKRNDTAAAVLSSQLFVIDVRSGEAARLTHDDRNYFNPQFSRDGRHIVCASSPQSGPVFGTGESDLELIEVGNGRNRLLVEGKGIRSRPSVSPDGRRLAYFESPLFVSRPVVQVRALEGSDASAHDMTSTLDRQVEDFTWGNDSRSIWVSYQDGLSDALARIALGRGPVLAGASGEPPLSIGSISSSAGAVAWQQEDPERLTTIQYLGPGTTRPLTLVDTQPQTRNWQLGTVKVLHWKNQRGDERDGALLVPPHYVPGRLYPLIVDAYPLVGGARWTSPMGGNQAWASAGYLVFRPSPRAPHVWMNPWKSEASSAAAQGPQGWQLTIDDVMSGVDEVVRRGYADPHRMCLYGFSNGGGVVNYLVTATDRFRCAVSVAGALSDWVRPALLNTGYDDLLKAWAGVGAAGVGENPRAYEQLSAVFRLHQAKTPMLLADGDDDGDFLLDTIEMYNGLRAAGVDVTLVRYPDQGHGFTGAAMADFWRREMAFFDRYLKP
jgi:dipeptidyl aminopeptidase/acylaminoacyl peptidase